jgi:hypothetical protein
MFLRGEEARPRQMDFLHIGPLSRAFAAFIHGADAPVTGWPPLMPRRSTLRCSCAMCSGGLFFAGLGATVYMYQHVPTGFIPQEDQSFLMGWCRRLRALRWPIPRRWLTARRPLSTPIPTLSGPSLLWASVFQAKHPTRA